MASRAIARYVTYKKLRLYVAWPAAVAALWFSRPTTESILMAAPLLTVGSLVRWWAAGCVRKGRALATGGIYAHVRHPLYLGSFVMLLGACVMLRQPLLWFVLPAGFGAFYWGTIRQEETELARKFGDSYRNYARVVPRFMATSDRTPSPAPASTTRRPRRSNCCIARMAAIGCPR